MSAILIRNYNGLSEQVANAGCETFIVHARKAWLSGLSPKENRQIPPLRYEVVYQLKQDFKQLEIILNGGINTLDNAQMLLTQVDGVMLGREVYHNPYILAQVDCCIFGADTPVKSRVEIAQALVPYIQVQLAQGVRFNSISRHILGLFHGEKGAKSWRRYLSEHATKTGADEQVLLQALALYC
jgi:tRNA-dihydrouridine synthase A